MSRVAKAPVAIPTGVEITQNGQEIKVKGKVGELTLGVNPAVTLTVADGKVTFAPVEGSPDGWAQAGTARALVNNMVHGVTVGFERKLKLVGIGYKAAAKGRVLNLNLGFSHPIDHAIPAGITAETPSQTEITLKGADKQLVGQTAANIRSYRKPEPYKGKGVRYEDEVVRRKEAKKK
jgi:large subunit ribosomal protein L6